MNWWEIGILVGVIYISMFFTYQVIKNIVQYIQGHRIVGTEIKQERDYFRSLYDELREENSKLRRGQ